MINMGSAGMAGEQHDSHVRRFHMVKRAVKKAESDAKAKPQEQVRKWLAPGGQRVIRSGFSAEIFSVHGDKRERESVAGEQTQVSQLLSPKLPLNTRQRATGNCYGHFAEKIAGGGANVLAERVDRSMTGSGGATERQMHMLRMVEVARKACNGPDITYPLGRPRGDKRIGGHLPVRRIALLDAVCLHGFTLEAIAVDRGWIMERTDGKRRGQMVVPDRQRKHLSEALRDVLDAVFDAWDARGMTIPPMFMQIEVE